MKRLLITLFLGAVWLTLAVFAHAGQPPQPLDLVLPGNLERLRLLLKFRGQIPEARWNEFLQRWFAYFDRDDDGLLSRAEAARVLPIPLPSRRTAHFDFDKADANNDGTISRTEFTTFYRAAGFQPVLAVVESMSQEDEQLGDSLFHELVPEANGKLTRARLNLATRLLRKLDENEDEVLTVPEILSLGRPPVQVLRESEFRWLANDGQSVRNTVHWNVDDPNRLQLRVEPKSLSLPGDRQRIRCANQLLDFSRSDSDPLHGLKTTRRFVMAQFDSLAGSAAHVDKGQIQDDGVFQVLHDLFPHADRDGNGKLTRAELTRFMDLVEQGITAPWLVTLTDRGRNLFCHLDANGDGRLDARELSRAADLFSTLNGGTGWEKSQVPGFAEIRIQQGFAGSSFGPLPLPAPANTSRHTAAEAKGKGPAWFRAMDRNGDGFLSPREFLGPLEVFRKLDLDGDGFISIAEAEQAAPK